MSEPTSIRDEALRARDACARFEADLNAFVDGERTTLEGGEIARHVDECHGCRAFVNTLAGMSRLHLFGQVEQIEPVDLPDGAELFGDFTRRLLQDNQQKLAAVLYELGKALVAAGLKTSSDLRGVQVYARKPGSIRQLSHKGEALSREQRSIASQQRARRGALLDSRRELFPESDAVEGSEAFETGRACLEQCLRLDTDRHEARIYLAKYFSVAGRYDRARQLLRTVLHSRADAKTKFFALQQLSRVYSATRQFERAVALEREVLLQAERDQNDLYQAAALTNLSIYCVKLGRLEEAEAAIDQLANRFSQHLETITVPAFRRAREFKQALLRHRSFLTRLRGRYPLLFLS
jgi:tetratricopeptide (TPR) repeat protein